MDLTGAKGILLTSPLAWISPSKSLRWSVTTLKRWRRKRHCGGGAVIDPEMSEELRVTVVATGLGGDRRPQFGIVDNGLQQASGSDVGTGCSRSQTSMYVPICAAANRSNSGERSETPEPQAQEAKPHIKLTASSDKVIAKKKATTSIFRLSYVNSQTKVGIKFKQRLAIWRVCDTLRRLSEIKWASL